MNNIQLYDKIISSAKKKKKDLRIGIRINKRLKRDAERVCEFNNTTLSSVITAFLKDLVDTHDEVMRKII